jgi:hypothetical protein
MQRMSFARWIAAIAAGLGGVAGLAALLNHTFRHTRQGRDVAVAAGMLILVSATLLSPVLPRVVVISGIVLLEAVAVVLYFA